MTTIYSTAGTFPLKIRESISTRFSGLIEYSATYLVEKGSTPPGFAVGTTIPTSSGSVSIFPGFRISRDNANAFDEMNITAYGHDFFGNNRVVYGTELLELSHSFQSIDLIQSPPVIKGWTVYETWRCETVTKHSVIRNDSTNYSDPSGKLDRRMIRRWIVGQVGSSGSGQNTTSGRDYLNIVWNTDRRDVSRTNFGAWDEVAVMKGYVPEVS
jgi:hypothetical protein